MTATLFVPEIPTLYPGMLLRRVRDRGTFPPFAGGAVHWCYFARNAIWQSARQLALAGGEILVPSYHHGVEIEALVHAGVRPVFYRVDRHWQVDLADVEARIGRHTRALYLIHYAGFPGPAAAMRTLADRHGLPLIEDCALSLLSADGRQPLGSTGDVAIFCLYKTLPVPNGGAAVFNRERAGDPLPALPAPPAASVFSHAASALLKNVEMRAGRPGRLLRRAVRGLGHRAVAAGGVERVATGTMHFDPAHLSLGVSPLTLRLAASQDFDSIIERRRRNYRLLQSELAEVAPPLFDRLPDGVCPLFYPLPTAHKPELLAALWIRGVEAVDFWRNHHPACDPHGFADTMWARRRIVEIPCHQDLDERTVVRLASLVRDQLLKIAAPPRVPVAIELG